MSPNEDLIGATFSKEAQESLEKAFKVAEAKPTVTQEAKNNTIRHRRRMLKFLPNRTYRKVPTIQK